MKRLRLIALCAASCVSLPAWGQDTSGIVFNCELRPIKDVARGQKAASTLLTILGQEFSPETKLPTTFRVFDPANRLQGARIMRAEKQRSTDGALIYKFKSAIGDPAALLLVVQGRNPPKIAPNGTLEMTATLGFADARGPQDFGSCNVFQHPEAAAWFERQTKLTEKQQ